jgi:SAM-dependent methyltransferase
MSHPNQLAFVSKCAEICERQGMNTVVEIGSCDVNGTVRSFFSKAKRYVGVDLSDGPGVDVVISGHEYGDADSQDLVVSSEVFEHNPYWLETFINMIRITKPGGCVIFTCASTGRLEHGTGRTDPNDSPGTSSMGWQYYRNLAEKDFTRCLNLDYHFSCYRFYSVPSSRDLYFIGTKKAGGYSARENSWLSSELDELDRLVKDLRATKQSRAAERHPFLQAIRRVPLNLAHRLLTDRQFQSFSIAYLRKTTRGRSTAPTSKDA